MQYTLSETNVTIEDILIDHMPDESEIGSPRHIDVVHFNVYMQGEEKVNITKALTKDQHEYIVEFIKDNYGE